MADPGRGRRVEDGQVGANADLADVCPTTRSVVGGRPYAGAMAHPVMFDDDDPLLARVRALALALPGAAEKVTHGRPAFFTAKVFAYYGGSIKVDGVYEQHGQSLVVKPDAGERRALVEDPRCYVPAYLGPSGWVGLDLPDDIDDDGWSEVAELLELSFRETAGKRLVAQLDAMTATA